MLCQNELINLKKESGLKPTVFGLVKRLRVVSSSAAGRKGEKGCRFEKPLGFADAIPKVFGIRYASRREPS